MSTFQEGNHLRIYVSCNSYPNNYVDCWCSRWTEGKWDVIIESTMSEEGRDYLFSNLVPGAYKELFNVLGTPHYVDTTWSSGNTIRLSPKENWGINDLENDRIIVVKNISDDVVTNKKINVKIEGMRLDI